MTMQTPPIHQSVQRKLMTSREELCSLKPSYERIVLLANIDDAELIGKDQSTLIVTYDWLLCQKLREAGYDAAHYEVGLLDWVYSDILGDDFHIHVNEWVYAGHRDMTVFNGVSLGKCFTGEMTLAMMNFYRMDRAIRRLIEITSCSVVVYQDYASEIGILDADQRQMLVQDVCTEMGVRYEGPAKGHVAKSNLTRKLQFDRKPPSFREYLARSYAVILSWTSQVRSGNKHPKIMLLANTNMLKALIAGYNCGGVTPIVHARTIPRQYKYLSWVLKQRVSTMTMVPSNLETTILEEISALREQIAAHLENRADNIPRTVRAFIQRQLLQSDKLEQYVADLLTAEANLQKFRPARLVVDGVRNPPNRLYIELAHQKGIPIDYIWHSPHVPLKNKVDALCGDASTRPSVTRVLTWGPVNEAWLDDIGARQKRIRVGGPLARLYANGSAKDRSHTIQGHNALLLQYTPHIQDLRGLNANTFISLIETVYALRRQGFDQIRIKLHPGTNRWELDYFEEVVTHFGLECPVYKYEPFHDMVEWADIVVGPLGSGALFETLAAGKPYYPFMIEPHSMDSSYYGDYPIFGSADELETALANKIYPEAHDLLNAVYSTDSLPDTVAAFWAAVSDFNNNQHT